MKQGNIVKIHDSSFSLVIVNGCLEHHPGEVQSERQLVIAVNCNLPADWGYCNDRQHNNDTIVQGITSGRITFTQQRFCQLPIREVTMAEVCSQFGQEVKIRKD